MKAPANLSSKSLQYYAEAKHWTSDLEFFKLETSFFHRLLDDYFIRLTSPYFIEKLKAIESKLLKFEEERHQADKMLTEQLMHIELMVEDTMPEALERIENKQSKLEDLMTTLIKDYRETKKELFDIVEKVMKDESLFNDI
jgi:CRISPR/Cas system CMR subunit Cmr4 (Cas7 group RAMP superfamily)